MAPDFSSIGRGVAPIHVEIRAIFRSRAAIAGKLVVASAVCIPFVLQKERRNVAS